MERAALVTGGSSGIGLAIARVLREERFALTLAANRPEQLAQAAEELAAEAVDVELEREEDCRRAVAEHERRFGRLDVLVNSAGITIFPVYAATKAGVVSLTRSLNADAAADGIRACAIAPGIVDTPMTASYPGPRDELLRPQDCAEVVRMLLRLSPRARIPLVELVRVRD